MAQIVQKMNELLERSLPPQRCRWCGHDLAAGEMFCEGCRGNRLVPSRWWPVMMAGLLLFAFASCALGSSIAAIWMIEGNLKSSAPAAAVQATSSSDQVTVVPQASTSTSIVDTAHTSTPEPTHTPTAELTRTPTIAPTSTSTLEPTHTPTSTPTLEPTHTPTVAPTSTSTPEPTHTSTIAPTSTSTLVPVENLSSEPLVPDPLFRADQTRVAAGSCTVLHWDVDGVQAVFLDGAGRPGHSSEKVCPEYTHTYLLRVLMPDGHEASYPLHVEVLGYLPLVLNVFVSARTCDTEESYAAEISIWAQGGDGQYTYYRDTLDQAIGGPTNRGMVHRMSWRTCGGAPGTFIVRSGDGQEARKLFWIEPPDCCGKGG